LGFERFLHVPGGAASLGATFVNGIGVVAEQ
jgi:hypothetical protein